MDLFYFVFIGCCCCLHAFEFSTDAGLPFWETWIFGKQFGTREVDFIKETTMDKTNKILLVLQDVI